MIRLKLEREINFDTCVMGTMQVEQDGKLIDTFDTLEPTDYGLLVSSSAEKIAKLKKLHPGRVAIPKGHYVVDTKFISRRFHGRRLCLKGVPGFSGILIHEGNYPRDTQGCILVGYFKASAVLINSRQVLQRLMQEVKAGARAEIIIYDKTGCA